MEVDIHNYNKQMDYYLKKLKTADIPESNREALLAFYRYCVATGISNGKIQRYIGDLLFLTRDFKIEYKDYTRKIVEEIVVRFERTKLSEWTKYSYKVGLRKFFKWFRGKGEVPEEVKWFNMSQKACNQKLPQELLTEEEVKKLITAANKPRDKALIACLYESGCRICEILTIKMKHVTFDNYGVVLNVNGKTGSRRVRLVFSISYLQDWLNKHPANDDPNSFVWIKESGNNELVGYDRVRILLGRIAKKANVKKKVNPHNFRHSRASFLANHLTESQLKEVFGWTQASKMAAVYVHLSGRNTDSAILKIYGKKIEDEVKGGVLLPKGCPRCKIENESTNKYCKLCGIPLDEEVQRELMMKEFKHDEAGKIMNLLLRDKEIVNLLSEKLQTMKNA